MGGVRGDACVRVRGAMGKGCGNVTNKSRGTQKILRDGCGYACMYKCRMCMMCFGTKAVAKMEKTRGQRGSGRSSRDRRHTPAHDLDRIRTKADAVVGEEPDMDVDRSFVLVFGVQDDEEITRGNGFGAGTDTDAVAVGSEEGTDSDAGTVADAAGADAMRRWACGDGGVPSLLSFLAYRPSAAGSSPPALGDGPIAMTPYACSGAVRCSPYLSFSFSPVMRANAAPPFLPS
ncbi:hypothetical protein C8R43DRAFT_1241251 [Mycena crocata]|nr:hypothetical protein C8R43DRAFT_1241251 [Mycena crocata]